MFENLDSLSVSGGGRVAGFRLESLEDRTTPAVVSTLATPAGSFAFDTSTLNGLTFTSATGVDQAFLSEAARISVMQWFLGTTEANQGSDPQIRAFGQQLANSEIALFNQLSSVLSGSGIPLQLTPIDQALISAVPGLAPTTLDSQFLSLSSLYGMQAAGLAQTESLLGTNANALAFAQSLFSPLQSQLQTGFGFLGPTATASTFNMFSTLGGFGGVGPFSTNVGVGTTAFGLTPFGANVGVGTTAFFTPVTGFGTFGAAPVGGFGPGATFGTSTGFGPSNTTTGFNNAGFGPANATTGVDTTGFGPANTTTGINNTGFGPNSTFATPGSVGTTSMGTPIF
ncbi:MAG: DUF4142 domain-containing protein [Planctomycetes bacterium]|nr:DUF4142 domain-containing protein [Planctomycetota bacterium]